MAEEMAHPEIRIGRIFAGKYRIRRLLGQGGMGVVFAVEHIELHEPFAIKLMQGREYSNPHAVERFLREARAAVRLRSKTEHIVQVYDVGRSDSGEPYIVMEILEGQDLGDLLLNSGVLSIAQACTYVLQACNALNAAHQLGIIHRDLKPANLFLTHRPDGSPCIKVLDFGISKHASDDDASNVEITGTQDVMGSPLYMSPELAKAARNASPRSDIWALGAILYKLLAGRAPIQAPSPAELFAELLSSNPIVPPTSFRPDIPPGLEFAILHCLEKRTTSRYENVAQLIRDIEPFTNVSAQPPPGGNLSTVLIPMAQPNLGNAVEHPWPSALGREKNANELSDSDHSGAAFNPLRRMVRRPSFVEGLPQGFELRPPPAPPSRPQAAASASAAQNSTSEPLHLTSSATHIPKIPSTSQLPTNLSANVATQKSPAGRPGHALYEATGATWGRTYSVLKSPKHLGLGVIGGFICIVIIAALVKMGRNPTESTNATLPISSALASSATSTTPPPSAVPAIPTVRPVEPLPTTRPSAGSVASAAPKGSSAASSPTPRKTATPIATATTQSKVKKSIYFDTF